MTVRESTDSEKQIVFDLHHAAFGKEERDVVAQLALDLLNDPTAHPLLSLVAEIDSEIVGSVLFSKVYLQESPDIEGSILAPLAVSPAHQKSGIGSTLIKKGIELLKERNTPFVMVLGDPKYYSRFGFHTNHNLKPPYDIPYPEAWRIIELAEGDQIEGTIQCADVLNKRDLW